MDGNFPDILADGFGSRHDDLNQKADLTLKGVVVYKLDDNIDDWNRFAWPIPNPRKYTSIPFPVLCFRLRYGFWRRSPRQPSFIYTRRQNCHG
ncbi:unnamed protein product [Lactuca virosa]|uniref:Uncharacterized protein n=1 Tax=Lactuca virosa TaxID=75947 RepID=A0AAU9MKZ8_9ASTR|nr:unnamed protein product [Lactuca virosa]